MKKTLMVFCLWMMLSSPVFAFLYQVEVLSVDQIKKVTEDKLIELYIEAKIEIDASRTFHGKSGFTPKEYERHKALLTYIVHLRQEMQTRQLEAPPVEEWLR